MSSILVMYCCLFLFCVSLVCSVLASAVSAQEAVLKDGHIIECPQSRISDEKLWCVGPEGKEVSILLRDIDVEKTRELNQKEGRPALDGQEEPTAIQTETREENQQSLGELARKANHGQGSKGAKHVFTDDDVAHAVDQNTTTPKSFDDLQRGIASAKTLIDKWAGKTPRELSDAAVRDTQFPGRDKWEKQLFEQKEKMVGAARAALDAAAKLAHGGNDDEQSALKRSISSLVSDLDWQRRQYDQIVAEGVKRAGEWERR